MSIITRKDEIKIVILRQYAFLQRWPSVGYVQAILRSIK